MDVEKSLLFYTDLLGFEVLFSRSEARFAYLGSGDAQLMLDQYSEGQGWGETGRLEPPWAGASICKSKSKRSSPSSHV